MEANTNQEECRTLTPEQEELVEAAGRYQHSLCFSCGERFEARGEGQVHADTLGHAVLEYIGRAPVN